MSFRFVDHTGEVEIHVDAATFGDVYAEAARALAALTTDPDDPGGASIDRDVVVKAPDRDALLAAFLDEIVFASETTKAIFPDVTITQIGEGELHATLHGRRVHAVRTPVKAATLHRLRVAPVEGGWSGTVVLDV